MFGKKKEVIIPQQQITIDLPYAIGSQFYDVKNDVTWTLKHAFVNHFTKTGVSDITYTLTNSKNEWEAPVISDVIATSIKNKEWLTIDEYKDSKANALHSSIRFGSKVNLKKSDVATTALILKKDTDGSIVFYDTRDNDTYTFSKQEFLMFIKAADSYEEVQ